jgi:hypothetical protein
VVFSLIHAAKSSIPSLTVGSNRSAHAAFANPAPGTWGDSGRNILQGPETRNVDFSVFKNTHITESNVLQLRAEFFNLFNNPQFDNPGATDEPLFQRLKRQIQPGANFLRSAFTEGRFC